MSFQSEYNKERNIERVLVYQVRWSLNWLQFLHLADFIFVLFWDVCMFLSLCWLGFKP